MIYEGSCPSYALQYSSPQTAIFFSGKTIGGETRMVRRLRTIEMKLHKMAEEFPNPIARESMEVIKHPESFRSFKHPKGSKKGDKMEGIQKVKQYLQRYGYLSSTHYSQTNTDEFDDALESAIKVFQTFYHLNHIEILDILESLTATQMSRPRCGILDHPSGSNTINPHGHHHLNIGTHYAFYPGDAKWGFF